MGVRGRGLKAGPELGQKRRGENSRVRVRLGHRGRGQGRSDGAMSGWNRVTETSARLWLQAGVAPGGGTPIYPRVLQRLGAPGRRPAGPPLGGPSRKTAAARAAAQAGKAQVWGDSRLPQVTQQSQDWEVWEGDISPYPPPPRPAPDLPPYFPQQSAPQIAVNG